MEERTIALMIIYIEMNNVNMINRFICSPPVSTNIGLLVRGSYYLLVRTFTWDFI